MVEQEESRRNYETIAREEYDEECQQELRTTVRTSDLQSTITVYVITVIADMCRGLLFPILWLRVQAIGGTAFSQGYVVASFSVGRLFGSLLLGLVVDCMGYYNGFLLTGCLVLLGSIIFVIAKNLFALAFAQFIMGLGAGRNHSYHAPNCKFGVSDYGGFTVTPVFGSLITYGTKRLGFSQEQKIFGITELTMPAVVLCLLSVISLLLVVLTFKEPLHVSVHHISYQPKSQQNSNNETKAGEKVNFAHAQSLPAPPSESSEDHEEQRHQFFFELAIVGSILQFLTKGAIGVFETLLVLYATKAFNFTEVQIGSSISSNGTIGVVFLLSFPYLLRYVKDVDLMLYGLFMMVVSNLILDSYFTRCKLQQWRFMLALLCMFGIGYPVGHTALLGLFAKIVRVGKQGGIMGWFGAVGSMARIIIPICAGAIAKEYGPSLVFIITGLLLAIALGIVGYARCKVTTESSS